MINKIPFNFESNNRDGLILQIHHTIPEKNDGQRRIRFVRVAFHPNGELLAACDQRNNVFIIDLASQFFWLLQNMGPCTVLEFTPKEFTLVIGCEDFVLRLVNYETRTVMGEFVGHKNTIEHVSFAKDEQCLSATETECIVWDFKTQIQIQKLVLKSGITIKFALFTPILFNILVCFKNDLMHIWKYRTFELLKQIYPAAWRNDQIKSITFTRNGRAMILGGRSQYLVIFVIDTWTINKVISLPDNITGIRQIEFIPQIFDGGSNKILGLLSSNCILYFYNVENNTFIGQTVHNESVVRKFHSSLDGKYLACVLNTGEINIYSILQLLKNPIKKLVMKKQIKPVSKTDKINDDLQTQMNDVLDIARLRRILKQFGEYPENFRVLIWKRLLNLPKNKDAFTVFINRGMHPAYKNLDKEYPLENKAALKNLQKILSCLCYWCPFFQQHTKVPLFVFPFVKFLQNDPFTCFEVVCSIIINYCQRWFEYYPLPPINILGMIENVLSERDPKLIDHFKTNNVTFVVYAWPMLETAFSEVLTKNEWLQLWDNILSNDPPYLLLAVVAYNIMFRSILLANTSLDFFKQFYHRQNPINMKQLIVKINRISNNVHSEIHPNKYLKPFKALDKGTYPIYDEYPKVVIDRQAKKKTEIREEKERLEREEKVILEEQVEHVRKLKESLRNNEEQMRQKKVEAFYKSSLQDEEHKILQRHQKVRALKKQLHDKQLEYLDDIQKDIMWSQTERRTAMLENLIEDINKKSQGRERQVEEMEDDVDRYRALLLANKVELEKRLNEANIQREVLSSQGIKKMQENLDEINEFHDKSMLNSEVRQMNIATRIAALDDMLQRVETELAIQMAEQQSNLIAGHENLKVIELVAETQKLEQEVEMLLANLAKIRAYETSPSNNNPNKY